MRLLSLDASKIDVLGATMDDFMQRYTEWLTNDYIDETTQLELRGLSRFSMEIEDRFYKDIEFGTGGLRGVLGAGTNRMNVYTVRKATQGLAEHVLALNETQSPAVAIAYDSRQRSPEFALEAALVLAGNGIHAYLYESLRPTPQLSYTVRRLNCSAGIVITASHNPSEYNGYKVYGKDGGQITSQYADDIIGKIQALKDWSAIKRISESEAFNCNLLRIIGSEMDREYLEKVKELTSREGTKDIRIVYTPLHGAGTMLVPRCFSELGYKNVSVVQAQSTPDPFFSTVASPNPEDPEAFAMAIAQAKRESADMVLATDPDCDRVGVAVKNVDGEYQILSGNQVGALLVNYVLSHGKDLPSNGAIVKTIVTSELGAEIARRKGFSVINTLTGFKYIGEKVSEFEKTQNFSFLMGYEESYGYLLGTFVRDKDAVIASMLIVEMAAVYRSLGYTLLEILESLYEDFGYYADALDYLEFKGVEGKQEIDRLMNLFRQPIEIKKWFPAVKKFEDYTTGIRKDMIIGNVTPLVFPKSNVMKFIFDDGSWFAVRPSGTEPKIKLYYSVIGTSKVDAEEKLKSIREAVKCILSR